MYLHVLENLGLIIHSEKAVTSPTQEDGIPWNGDRFANDETAPTMLETQESKTRGYKNHRSISHTHSSQGVMPTWEV